MNALKLGRGDALIVVDVQNDFLPGGALAVPHGEEVVPILNAYIRRFVGEKLPVFATRDWHPPNHCSFKTEGGRWPPHCIASTHGAEFAAGLELPPDVTIVSKGNRPDREAYSGFEGTDLEDQLRIAGAQRLFIGGLATDYCVASTVRDARSKGFPVYLLTDAVRAVNVQPGDGKKAEKEMERLGASPISLRAMNETFSDAIACPSRQTRKPS